jgi:hypothetical protein
MKRIGDACLSVVESIKKETETSMDDVGKLFRR